MDTIDSDEKWSDSENERWSDAENERWSDAENTEWSEAESDDDFPYTQLRTDTEFHRKFIAGALSPEDDWPTSMHEIDTTNASEQQVNGENQVNTEIDSLIGGHSNVDIAAQLVRTDDIQNVPSIPTIDGVSFAYVKGVLCSIRPVPSIDGSNVKVLSFGQQQNLPTNSQLVPTDRLNEPRTNAPVENINLQPPPSDQRRANTSFKVQETERVEQKGQFRLSLSYVRERDRKRRDMELVAQPNSANPESTPETSRSTKSSLALDLSPPSSSVKHQSAEGNQSVSSLNTDCSLESFTDEPQKSKKGKSNKRKSSKRQKNNQKKSKRGKKSNKHLKVPPIRIDLKRMKIKEHPHFKPTEINYFMQQNANNQFDDTGDDEEEDEMLEVSAESVDNHNSVMISDNLVGVASSAQNSITKEGSIEANNRFDETGDHTEEAETPEVSAEPVEDHNSVMISDILVGAAASAQNLNTEEGSIQELSGGNLANMVEVKIEASLGGMLVDPLNLDKMNSRNDSGAAQMMGNLSPIDIKNFCSDVDLFSPQPNNGTLMSPDDGFGTVKRENNLDHDGDEEPKPGCSGQVIAPKIKRRVNLRFSPKLLLERLANEPVERTSSFVSEEVVPLVQVKREIKKVGRQQNPRKCKKM